jgi:hypothetical protein
LKISTNNVFNVAAVASHKNLKLHRNVGNDWFGQIASLSNAFKIIFPDSFAG